MIETRDELIAELPLLLRPTDEPLSDQEIEAGYHYWLRSYKYASADKLIEPWLEISQPTGPLQLSLLRFARTSLLISKLTASKKLGGSKNSFWQLEESEIKGSITIASLRKAAEAIDCELVYCIKPKNQTSFSRIVWMQLVEGVRNHIFLFRCVARHRHWALAALARDKLREQKFRLERGWSRSMR